MPEPKIATCCYCGSRAALVLSDPAVRRRDADPVTFHELTCGNCGAPIRHLKPLKRSAATTGEPSAASTAPPARSASGERSTPKAARTASKPEARKRSRRRPEPERRERPQPPRNRKRAEPRRRKRRKSLVRRFFEEATDFIEDIFD